LAPCWSKPVWLAAPFPPNCLEQPLNFHIAHIIPPGKAMHGLNGYKEVIDSVIWGLEDLGHKVGYSLNTLSTTATNIIFGAQMMALETLEQLPPQTIVYNFEQIKLADPERVKSSFKLAARRFNIWDYSESNRSTWEYFGADSLRVVPVGFAPILERIAKNPIQDIDVLMYGSPDNYRLEAFHHLYHSGLRAVFVGGLYGTARDDLIARSKLIVNINRRNLSRIFEVVRVSYLLANRKAVVSIVEEDTAIDEDMRRAIMCSSGFQLVEHCHSLIDNDQSRESLETAGFEVIRQRDIRKILAAALDGASEA
jgi:hypothetical protein